MTGNNCADKMTKVSHTAKKTQGRKKENMGEDDEIAFLQGHPRHVPVLS